MAQNTGTLITAAIRPNDSQDRVATALSSEIQGGIHSKETIVDRNAIIEERRDWGMLCYVEDDKKTYQLSFGEVDQNINNNNNWIEFSGNNEADSDSQWLNSVISVELTPPSSPATGSRYLGGTITEQSLTGTWNTDLPGVVFEWNSSEWLRYVPKNGDTIRVNNEGNLKYRYDGEYPNGNWKKENVNQIIELNFTTSDNIFYEAETDLDIDYSYLKNTIVLANFSSNNNNIDGEVIKVDINSLGVVDVRKPSEQGLTNLTPNDVITGQTYTLVYNGNEFELIKHYTSDSLKLKNYITKDDYIIVPENHQYWIYGDLDIEGTLLNFGEVVISNGVLNLIGDGVFGNDNGELTLVSINESLGIQINSTDTISVTEEETIFGLSYSFNINDNSIGLSKLDIGNFDEAVDGYILSNENGVFKWIENTGGGSSAPAETDTIYQVETPNAVDGNNQNTGITMDRTPVSSSSLQVFVNGQSQIIGDGVFTTQCYFTDNDGLSALNLDDVSQGSELFYNSSVSGYELTDTDTVLIIYEA